ncbi:uncharacterized protein K452DRAFT_63502 [Aplosporella prunicola CBS 121167]|uniref:Uncharacterized protein n=1 Tax=Aplosporella prunicola CBS 121167 TaxID=1176127 RepID=A0A6A6B6A5_9PEZI|nr:uncharacterized protein K452DRAFT_63502 [Aplosporella prunicola CBS 121167]KAF2139639.1 hypothetical protein K452DRAFT_63502 [Aplosporella prunicola CBS 121167]
MRDGPGRQLAARGSPHLLPRRRPCSSSPVPHDGEPQLWTRHPWRARRELRTNNNTNNNTLAATGAVSLVVVVIHRRLLVGLAPPQRWRLYLLPRVWLVCSRLTIPPGLRTAHA